MGFGLATGAGGAGSGARFGRILTFAFGGAAGAFGAGAAGFGWETLGGAGKAATRSTVMAAGILIGGGSGVKASATTITRWKTAERMMAR